MSRATRLPLSARYDKDPVMYSLFAFFGLPGHFELLIFLVIVLLLFGNRLPSVMRSMGRGIVEFKKGVQGIEEDIDGAVNAATKPAKSKDDE